MLRSILSLVLWLATILPSLAQTDDPLVVGTVTRPPFSMSVDGVETGFALDLWAVVADALQVDYTIRRFETFPEMLAAVETGDADAAVANISVTAEREALMDFTQPIFSAGVQILVPPDPGFGATLRTALSPRLIGLVLVAVAGLLVLGMLMWLFERKRQDFFEPTARASAFPAFWWALNVLVTGAFGEKTPHSIMGRIFGVLMIVGSLFVVSLFVANITASMTLDALGRDVERLTDLDGRRVGTTIGSTTSALLNSRGVSHRTFADLDGLLGAFEAGELDAVAFDGPILAYYVQTDGQGRARLIDRVFQREYYAVALPTGSDLREPINRVLLRLEEDGTYADLQRRWFGLAYADR
ncbi:MAG: transporter substrate-binding domain-containing protein [Pseudomonadota bacterium]